MGQNYPAEVGSLSPFLNSLKIVVLRVEVNLFLLLHLLTALQTKAPSDSQNLRMKLTVNPSTPGPEVPFISSSSAFVISCKVILPSMETLMSSESFILINSLNGSKSSSSFKKSSMASVPSFTSCLLNIFSNFGKKITFLFEFPRVQ